MYVVATCARSGLLTQVVIRKVNEDIDIPLLSERREARIIEKFVDRIVPKVEPSLQAIMPDIYVRCVCQKHWFPRHILAVLILGVGNPHAVD